MHRFSVKDIHWVNKALKNPRLTFRGRKRLMAYKSKMFRIMYPKYNRANHYYKSKILSHNHGWFIRK